MREVWIRGAAMTRFGRQPGRSARDLVEEALAAALQDAEIGPHDVQAAYVGNAVAGLISGQESIRAQVVLRGSGLMGVPMVNVENACASSSTALHLAWQAVVGGIHDCVVVVGYEKMHAEPPDAERLRRALSAPMDVSERAEDFGVRFGTERNPFLELAGAAAAGSGQDLFDRRALAMVSVKNHEHASLNPFAHHREPVSLDQVLTSPPVAGALTRLMCATPSDGAACLVLCAGDFRRGRASGARVAASVLVSGRGDDLRQPQAAGQAMRLAYETSGVGPEDLDVAEVYDLTPIHELLQYRSMGLCERAEAARLIAERVTWLGGRLPVNPSGGLLARGHPMGAAGAAQVVELAWQLQGRCGRRQVSSPKLALASMVGGWLGSDIASCAVHMLQV